MSDAEAKPREKNPAEKEKQKKRRELQDLKSRIRQLRESTKTAVEERKGFEARAAKLMGELGITPKKKHGPASA